MDNTFVKTYNQIRRRALERYYAGLNEMQRQAVFRMDGPLLILAGAGSGKTTVLINRIENMVRFGRAYLSDRAPAGAGERELELLTRYLEGQEDASALSAAAQDTVRPWNILAITFTNKAAGELRQRLEDKLGETGRGIHASTFHSLCMRILRREIEALGYKSSFTVYDTDDSLRLIKEGLRAAQVDEKMLPPKSVLSAISRAKDAVQSPQELLKSCDGDYRMQCVARVYDYYQRRLQSANALDFDDIILLTVRLFRQYPEVLERYQDRYRYIMVDEYQDTNHTQYLLISLLAEKHKNLCVVGDDDQSIYKFRGATIENILSFENQFDRAAVIRLEQNYRSTQNILSAANNVIANNTARKGKNLWTSAGDGEPVQVYRLRDEVEESTLIAGAILDNMAAGAKFSDHAVLYRMNAQSNSLEKALARNAIPYRIIGGLRFYERKEIKDIVACLSVLDNPADDLRLLRIVNEPKRGIGDATVEHAREIAGGLGLSLFEVLSTADEYPALAKKSPALQAFAGMLRSLARRAESEPLDALLDALLDATGYRAMLEAQGFEGAGRLENILELKSNIVKYIQENEEPSLSGFLEEIALYTDLDNYDASADSVVLMTVHAAKGLEFPYVFLAGMDEGIFPGRAVQANPAEIEEERRLAYVAITRAKARLVVTSAERRMLFGQTVYGRTSRFIGEIPPQFVQVHDKTLRAAPPAGPVKRSQKEERSFSKNISVGGGSPFRPADIGPIKAGDRVRHKAFGEGEVLSARKIGADTLVEVRFGGAGVKKVMANAFLSKV